MDIKQVDFENPGDFLNYFISWGNPFNGFIFRGHSDENYKLIPSALRLEKREELNSLTEIKILSFDTDDEYFQIQIEYLLLKRFYKMADRQGLRVPNSDQLREGLNHDFNNLTFKLISGEISWLPPFFHEVAGLAQHYGIPTRLLDWSYDPFVAIHFALKDAIDKKGRIAIWCLNQGLLGNYCSMMPTPPVLFVTPPYYDNPNLNAQKGLFTHTPIYLNPSDNENNLSTPVERRALNDIISSRISSEYLNYHNVLTKVTLPCEQARRAYIALEEHGYGLAKIFPGYKGIAQQILETRKLRNG